MYKLAANTKDHREAAALCSQINLFGFVDGEAFLTKSGDVGVVIAVDGVDYECLDNNAVENVTRRLAAAFRVFDEKCRVYQYLFKRNHETIPYKTYGNPIVNAAIQNRIEFLKSKADSLYSFQICYVVLYEGFRYHTSILNSLGQLPSHPKEAMRELQGLLSSRKQAVLIDSELASSLSALHAKARSFLGQVGDFVEARVLGKADAFRVLKQVLNFSPLKLETARLTRDTFLDYFLAESHIECHRGHLRLDDYYVKVLTLKEPSAQSFPLIFRRLLEVQANYYVVTEWKKEDSGKTRRTIQAKRRHFHNTKRSFFSQVNLNDTSPHDVLLDDSKESQVRELGEGIKEIELHGNYF